MMNPRQVQIVRGDVIHFTDGTKHAVAENAVITVNGEKAALDCILAGDAVVIDGNPATTVVVTRTPMQEAARRGFYGITPEDSRASTVNDAPPPPTTTPEPEHHTTHRKRKH